MSNIMMYNKICRYDNYIIEEKLDGSNFCWYNDNGKLRFFSRKKEIILGEQKFFDKFINYVNDLHMLFPFFEGVKFFAEVLGQGHIKYGLIGVEKKSLYNWYKGNGLYKKKVF